MRSELTPALLRLGKACLQALTVMVVVTLLVFIALRLIPGDPARQALGAKATPTAVRALRSQLGLDKPWYEQLATYVSHLLRGDLGESVIRHGVGVGSIVMSGLAKTSIIVACCVVFSLIVGVGLGLLSGATKIPLLRGLVRVGSVVSLATPPFFFGLLGILIVSLQLGLLPAGGWGPGAGGAIEHTILPSLALSGYLVPLILRAVSQASREAFTQPYVEAARARGLRESTILVRHVLPNSILPLITLVGLNAGGLISGAVVVEAVFAVPGLGTELATAVQELDYPVIQGIAIITALIVVGSNLCADALYTIADPRTRASQ